MIQDTNVECWLQYGNSSCTVENSVIESTDADGLNFNGNASNCTVKNNFIRNTGDDGLAIWSYPTADSNITFANNTIVQPTLANGIADYGGSNNTISNNVIAGTNALGSGLDISNGQFLTPFTPLSGTITVSGNYLIRTGAYNTNWSHRWARSSSTLTTPRSAMSPSTTAAAPSWTAPTRRSSS